MKNGYGYALYRIFTGAKFAQLKVKKAREHIWIQDLHAHRLPATWRKLVNKSKVTFELLQVVYAL